MQLGVKSNIFISPHNTHFSSLCNCKRQIRLSYMELWSVFSICKLNAGSVLLSWNFFLPYKKKYKYCLPRSLGSTPLEETFRTVHYESPPVFQNYSAGLCHVINDALRRCQMIVSAKSSVQKDNKVPLQQVHFGSIM